MQSIRKFLPSLCAFTSGVLLTLGATMLMTPCLSFPRIVAPRGVMTESDATAIVDHLTSVDRFVKFYCPRAVESLALHPLSVRAAVMASSDYDVTENLGLHLPHLGSIGWGPQLNYDFDVIDWAFRACLVESAEPGHPQGRVDIGTALREEVKPRMSEEEPKH